MKKSDCQIKILAIDCWSRGRENLERLLPDFKRNSLQLKLLHVGSWGFENKKEYKRTSKLFPITDISNYKKLSIIKILKKEHPDLVIFTNTDSFYSKAFIRYCRILDIPTIHLFHGLQQLMMTTKPNSKILKRIFSLRKYVWITCRHSLPAYLRSLYITRAKLDEWFEIPYDVIQRIYGIKHFNKASSDSLANHA